MRYGLDMMTRDELHRSNLRYADREIQRAEKLLAAAIARLERASLGLQHAGVSRQSRQAVSDALAPAREALARTKVA